MENTSSPIQSANRRAGLFVSGVLVLFAIGSIAGGYYFFFLSRTASTVDTGVGQALPKAALTATEIGNPVQFFHKTFSAKNYHVRVINTDGVQNFSFYYEKGVLVRIDGEGKYSSDNVSIIKEGKLYSINEKDKTFVEMNLDHPSATYLMEIYKVASILDPILQGETPTAPVWTAIDPQSTADRNTLEFQSLGRKFVSYVPGSIGLVDIKMTLNVQTGLITAVSLKSPKDPNWNAVTFQYEEISDMASLKRFPADYKKVDPV